MEGPVWSPGWLILQARGRGGLRVDGDVKIAGKYDQHSNGDGDSGSIGSCARADWVDFWKGA